VYSVRHHHPTSGESWNSHPEASGLRPGFSFGNGCRRKAPPLAPRSHRAGKSVRHRPIDSQAIWRSRSFGNSVQGRESINTRHTLPQDGEHFFLNHPGWPRNGLRNQTTTPPIMNTQVLLPATNPPSSFRKKPHHRHTRRFYLIATRTSTFMVAGETAGLGPPIVAPRNLTPHSFLHMTPVVVPTNVAFSSSLAREDYFSPPSSKSEIQGSLRFTRRRRKCILTNSAPSLPLSIPQAHPPRTMPGCEAAPAP